MKKFSDRLDESIKKSGKTQKQIAKESGIPLTTLTNWLLGIREMKAFEALARLCSQLGVSADWMLGLDKSAAPGVSVNGSGNATAAAPNASANVGANIDDLRRTLDAQMQLIQAQQAIIDNFIKAGK